MSKAPFEHIVTEHGPTVLRVCLAVLTRPDAQDAWSETFLAALRAYPELPAEANIEAWLVTIAHRKAIDIMRVRARTPVPLEQLPERPAPTTAPDEGLWAAVQALPTKQRQVIAYRYLVGLPHQEIADIVGGTAAAARRAAADGIRTLRRSYPTGAASTTELTGANR